MFQDNKFPGLIKVVDIIENTDGSARVIFEADEKFKQAFKDINNLKRWSQKRFELFLQQAIDNTVRLHKEGLLNDTAKK